MTDVLISCMGVRKLPDWLPWQGKPPVLLEWAGAMGAGGHPGWAQVARRLRGPDGSLLRNLLAQYRRFLGFDLDGVDRIAVVGFSAGSNSGVRELLRSPLDRARISWVAAVDGMHPMWSLQNPTEAETEADVRKLYQDWPGQMDPFAQFALEASDLQGNGFVCTASQVAAPSSQVAPTSTAIHSLARWVLENRTGPRLPPDIPKTFPGRRSAPYLHPGELYPEPIAGDGAGPFVALWYQGSDERAHRLQAYVVVPDLLRSFLVPLWGGPQPQLAAFGEVEAPPPEILSRETRPVVRGLPDWTPGLVGAASAALVAIAVA